MKRTKLLSTVFATALMGSVVSQPVFAAPKDNNNSDSEAETTLSPYYGRINPFYGRINPFEGDVDPFYGRINPFDGEVTPFWGRINPFEGDVEGFWGRINPFYGRINPFYGRINPFWGRINPFMGDLQANWGRINPFDSADPASHEELIAQFNTLIVESESFWGPRVSEETGESFYDGFVADLLAKYGIDLNDPSSLDGFDEVTRAQFQFDWYDGLMSFSGADHVDHWMETANWSPAITQIAGSGTDTVIGLIDFTVTPDADLQDNLVTWGGYENALGGHGGAVASLLVADHDGQGIMGIAPNATVAAYNPFDETHTASWEDVRTGVRTVVSQGASVVNMSLGVPGSTFADDWAEVYTDPTITALRDQVIFVQAAGNDGLVQTTNPDMRIDFVDLPHIILVGSIGPSGQISEFSNTPGEACFIYWGSGCNGEEYTLKNHFIVAPGEWILVSDGEGGVTRMSGTSFAAPIVTGAIALLHDRWGWLKDNPAETKEIIFATADDLGEEGVDAVYGHGALNITASQSPIDWNNVYQLSVDPNSGREEKNYLSTLNAGEEQTLLNTEEGYVTVYEDIGDTFRDFIVPLDSMITGVGLTSDGSEEALQSYLTESMIDYGTSTDGKGKGKGKKKFVELAGMTMSMRSFALPISERASDERLPFASEFSMSSDNTTFSFGNGVGAMSLSGASSASYNRFDQQSGGANPVLGLASGGAFAKLEVPAFGSARLSVGTTHRHYEDVYADQYSGEQRFVNEAIEDYEAMATNIALTQPLSERLSVTASYTYLQENNAALGMQSTLDNAFNAGAKTDAATLGAQWQLNDRAKLYGSATFGQTRAQSETDQLLSVGQEGIATTAYEVAFEMNGLFAKSDFTRLALVQPMHVEQGNLAVSGTEVLDRNSGELGFVTREFDVAGVDRKLALEASWGSPFKNDTMAVSGFVRLEMDTHGDMSQGNQMAGIAARFSY